MYAIAFDMEIAELKKNFNEHITMPILKSVRF